MRRLAAVVTLSVLCFVAALAATQGQGADRLNAEAFKTMTVRNIGPTLVTGRVADIELDPKNPSIWYVASSFGGLWKTENRGQTFTEIFPRSGEVESFNLCCVVVDPKDSNIVWLGTGEDASQRSAHFGTGLYKSTDAGKTWKLSGLPNSEHIGNIVIDPRNSNHVYVASQGPLFSEGGDRGVYKTTDGGANWSRILHVNDDTGFNEVALDAKNPDILIAGTYQRRRHVGQMIGGGPDGGIWRSTNAGKNWTKMSKGLPGNGVEVGRISFAVDPKRPGRMYAMIDGKCGVPECGGGRGGGPAGAGAPGGGRAGGEGAAAAETPAAVNNLNTPTENDARGFYVSNDSGASWERVSRYRGGGPAYYSEIHVDPRTPDTIWSVNTNYEWSKDGGKTWTEIGIENSTGRGAFAVHVDHHEVVFDPTDPNHIIIGNDGGVYDSYDGGKNWRLFANLPITQFYRVSAGNEEPFYTVCGGTQDNFSICGPSRTNHTLGTRTSDWYIVNGGDGFTARHDLTDPNIVFATSQDGGLVRFDRRTGRSQSIRPNINTAQMGEGVTAVGQPAPAGGGRGGRGGGVERTNWDAPYVVSTHEPGRLYWANNFVYRSDDRGATWTRISGDLSRNLDAAALPIMGKVWPQGSIALRESTTSLSNVVSIDESPLLEGLIVVGTDDGLVQITENGGKEWRKVEDFPGVPKWAYVSDVTPSPRDANVIFVALNNWQRGDYKPYVVRSDDRGRSWKNISGDLPAKHDVWALAQDHVNPNLIFAGTEFGLFFTVDGGSKWVQLKGGMPPTQVRDLQIQRRESDVVMGTFGRGFWILDDYSPLREVTAATLGEEARLFPMRHAYQFTPWGLAQDGSAGLATVGGNYTFPNPNPGATLTYNVKDTIAGDTRLVARIFNEVNTQVRQLDLNKNAGVNRTIWDLRTDVAGAGAPEPEVALSEEEREREEARQQVQQQQTPPPPPQGGQAGAQGRGAGAGGAAPQGGRQGGAPGGGRGGGPQGNLANPGRYRVVIGKLSGDTFTQVGPAQTFVVKTLPERNYQLWR